MLIFHVGCVWILSIVFGLYNCGIWHRGCSITYTPPYAKKLCQKELCRLLLDYADCNWIVQLYLDCTIVIGLYDCNWIVRLYLDCTIVIGLYGYIWIVRLYLDCTIVFGLYYCIWIVLLYLDYIIAGFVLPILPPPLCQKVVPKTIVSIVVGIYQLYLDYGNCIWMASIVFGLCRLQLDCFDFGIILGQRPISRPPHPA